LRRSRYLALWIGAGLILIYIAQHLLPGLTDQLIFRPATVADEPWTYVTSMFIHAPDDYMHLLNNLFFLIVFGTMLELLVGSERFLGIFLIGGLVANLSAFTFYPDSAVLGASGAISAIIASLAVFRPRKPGLFWGVPVPMWAALLGWIGTNLIGTAATGGGIAFEAHLYGLGFGAIAGIYLRQLENSSPRQKRNDRADGPIEIDEQTIREWERRYMQD
jgi:membrane associated rhomboid family serine protease